MWSLGYCRWCWWEETTMHILQPMPHPKSSENNSIMLHVFPCTPDPTRVAEQVDPLFYDLCDVIWNAFPLTKATHTRFFPVTFWIFLGVLGDHFRAPFGWSKFTWKKYLGGGSKYFCMLTTKTWGNDPIWRLHIFSDGCEKPPTTPLKFNIAPENRQSQKETHLPTIIFQGLC